MEAFAYFIRRATGLKIHPLWYFFDLIHDDVIDVNKITWVRHQILARHWGSEEQILTFAGEHMLVRYEIERIPYNTRMI